MADFFRTQTDYLLFSYGLSLILLASCSYLLNRRPHRLLPWKWLGFFGAAHGLNVWLDLLALDLWSSLGLDLARLALITASWVFLVEFGRAGVLRLRGRGPGRGVLAALLGVALLGGIAGMAGLFAASRYILGLAGGLWAAGTLYLAARAAGPGKLALSGAALGMAAYALATGLVVNPAPFVPASRLNATAFLAASGVPIQLLSGLLIFWIAACLVCFGQSSLEPETEPRLRGWRRTLLCGTAATMVGLLMTGWFTTQYFGGEAAKEIRTIQESHAQLLSLAIQDDMRETDHLADALAASSSMLPALENRDTLTLQQVNQTLDRYSTIYPGAVCYLMDREGLTIAASNRHRVDSFVGRSYKFRPYFQQAIQGEPGRFWALGVTSQELGYYASYPVRDHVRQIVGVAVFKHPISDVQRLFPPQGAGFIIDPQGIVVMASQPEMVLQSLWPLSPATREQVLASRQFGPGPFKTVLSGEPADRTEAWFQGKRQLVLRQPLLMGNWSTVILMPLRPVILGRLLGMILTLLFGLAAIGFLTIMGLTLDAAARLQSSERRYRGLYESLRDGSAAVNLEGRFTECNPEFQNMLGYTAAELGRLTYRDITPEKWHAVEAKVIEEQVLPRGYSDLFEKELRRRDGAVFPVELQIYLIRDHQGRPAGIWALVRDVTARKQAEAALAEEAIRRRILMGQSRDGIVVLDQNGKVYEANQRYADMLGYSPEEVRHLHVWDWDAQWTREELLEQVRSVDAAGDHFETRHRRKDGSLLDVEISTNGAVLGGRKLVFCVCRDISPRKAAERALRESEEKYRLVFEKAPIGIMHYDPTSAVIDCNEKFAAIIGAPKEKFIGFNMIRQLRNDQLRAAVAASLQGEVGYYDGDYLSVTAGKLTPARAIFQPVFSPEGVLSGGVTIFEDITERKAAEETLRITRESLELALKGADLGTWDWNLKTGAVTFNERWAEMLGYRLDEVEPHLRSWEKLVHPEDLSAIMRALNAHLEGKTPFYETEYRLRHKSGAWVWVLVKGKVIERDAQGQPVRACGTHLDITERQRAEVERLHFNKLESLSTLAGGIAHDFNNILTAILGNISLARLDRQAGQRLADAENACLRAKALAHQLLTFAKGGAPIKELCAVAKLVTETGSFACRGSNVRCEFSLPDNLWTIYADSGQLGQVFQNLVINALQAMPTGGVITTQGENLVVEAGGGLPLDPGKYVKISIQDQGLGIPAEYLTRIFDPYFTTKQTGSGLGLATAYSIIKAHQGHITVESTLGAGTLFQVYLPAAGEKLIELPKGDQGVIRGEGKILVMDDEELVREIIGRMLGHLGYEAAFAGDGDEAIRLFTLARQSGTAFDAVILDLTVPGGMGGKAALEKLLQIDPQVKAIVSSGYSEDTVMADFAQHGFSGVIAKPYRIAELGALLHRVIGKG